MRGRVNPITMFLVNSRGITPISYAQNHKLSTQDFLNTITGIKPKVYICCFLFEEDREIFNLLPEVARINIIVKKEKRKEYVSNHYYE